MAALSAAVGLALLALAAQQAPRAVPEEGASWERAAALAADDPARAREVRALLAERPGPLDEAALRVAWETGVAAARALGLEDAIAIQGALDERHPAPWSAMDLALTLGLAGRTDEADSVLERALERADRAASAELWSRRGLLWLGAGDERRARDGLGRALARGSGDAAVLLAWLDLERGLLREARAGFRPGLYDDPPGAWSLRGWGLCLLPPARPATPRAPTNPEDPSR